MKVLFLIVGFFVSFSAYSKEDCSLGALKLDKESDEVKKLFYTGTCHYRNNDYEKSAELWQKLIKIETNKKETQDLQIIVLNNLGYLMFYGLGVDENKSEAISYWKKAITLGETEAEYHLCHAYADNKEPTYNRRKAQLHCKKALLIYRGMEPKDEEILTLIENYYDKVK